MTTAACVRNGRAITIEAEFIRGYPATRTDPGETAHWEIQSILFHLDGTDVPEDVLSDEEAIVVLDESRSS